MLAALLLLTVPAAAEALPRGQVVEVLHAADPNQTYALYLPTSYDPARPAPIVYLLDPRGRALVPLERFRAGAEAMGFVLASSYRSRSDESTEPNGPALSAMWTDTHARLALDDHRAFVAGFSGTARAAWALASLAKGAVAGVIAAGAGLATGQEARGDPGFLYYGAAGDTDFNYQEMQELDEKLFELGVPYRFEVFPGPHDWMPAEVATRALEWMAIRMHPGPPGGFLEAVWKRDVGRARDLEASGRLQDSWRLWTWIARDHAGRADANEAQTRAAALRISEARKAEEKARRKGRERERAALERAQQAIAAARAAQGDSPSLPRLLSELQLGDLKRRARGEGEDSRSAQRILNSIQSQVGFYLPRDATRRRAHGEAAFFLIVASEIRPEDSQIWYHLAAAQARAGRKKPALDALEHAIDAGFSDRARLETDADLASLRREPGFPRLVARLP